METTSPPVSPPAVALPVAVAISLGCFTLMLLTMKSSPALGALFGILWFFSSIFPILLLLMVVYSLATNPAARNLRQLAGLGAGLLYPCAMWVAANVGGV